MAKTFCNDALTASGRHSVKTEKCHYVMSGSWIDTTCPSDMMDYDFTASFRELREMHERFRLNHNDALAGKAIMRKPK